MSGRHATRRASGHRRDDDNPEVDLEGAAWLGERIYWIGSHGRNRNGKWRANRLRFFATRIEVRDGRLEVPLAGRASSGLLDALLADTRLQALDFAASVGRVGKNEDDALAPEGGGLNIEGLSATADGRALLIAFRNPRPGGKALLVPLTNPAEVVDSGARPQLGAPILLDLGGLGVRSIDFCVPCRAFLLVAGPHDGAGAFVLFRWSGQAADAPVRLHEIADFRPEALAVAPDGRVLVLSDDGDEPHAATAGECGGDLVAGRCACKDLKDARRRSFRGRWLDPAH